MKYLLDEHLEALRAYLRVVATPQQLQERGALCEAKKRLDLAAEALDHGPKGSSHSLLTTERMIS